MGVSIEQSHVSVYGNPSETKDEFHQKIQEFAVATPMEVKMFLIFGNANIYNKAPAIYFLNNHSKKDNGAKEADLAVYYFPENFILGDEDFSDLIPYALYHEAAETWIFMKPGYSLPFTKEKKSLAHAYALVEMYEVALRDGRHDRLLQFMLESAKKFPDLEEKMRGENISAYQKVVSRNNY